MSIFNRSIAGNDGKVQGLTIKSADVRKRLEAAEESLRLLRLRYGPIAFSADEGDSTAFSELQKLTADIREAEDKVRYLTATLAEAERLEALAEQVARENLYHSQASAARAHAATLKIAAVEYAEAEAARAKAWRKMVISAEKAQAACPIGFEWPTAWPRPEGLATLAAFEAYRVSAPADTIGKSAFTLPFAAPPFGKELMPSAIEPLTDMIAAEVASLSEQLKAGAEKFR